MLAILETIFRTDSERIRLNITRLSNNDSQTRRQAVLLLNDLVRKNPDNQNFFLEAEGLQLLINLLNDTDAETRNIATSTVAFLAHQKPDNREAIREAGGILPLVGLLEDPNTLTRQYASSTLLNFCFSAVNKDAIRVAQGIPLLTTLLQDTDALIRQNTTRILWGLVFNNPTNQAALIDHGALPTLAELASNDEYAQKTLEACKTLQVTGEQLINTNSAYATHDLTCLENFPESSGSSNTTNETQGPGDIKTIHESIDIKISENQNTALAINPNSHRINSPMPFDILTGVANSTAIKKIQNQYRTNLRNKNQDLEYYVCPNVVDNIPNSIGPEEYVSKIENNEIQNDTRLLLTDLNDYLKSNEQMMLLFGDSGAGKSLFSWYSTRLCSQKYRGSIDSAGKNSTSWLPIVIELKNYRLSEIKDLLPRYLTDVCKLTTTELQAIQSNTKSTQNFILVLDGFDELKQEDNNQTEQIKKTFEDCLKTCGAEAWHAKRMKLIVTCRSGYIPDILTKRQYFGYGREKTFRHRVILPFSSLQIETYLNERVHSKAEDSNLLSVKDYTAVIQNSPSIKTMVRNPFGLRFFVDALHALIKEDAKQDLTKIKRYDIYRAFVQRSFELKTALLPAASQDQLPIRGYNSSRAETTFELYAATLANEMYQQDTLVINLNRENSHPAITIWKGLEARINADKNELPHGLDTFKITSPLRQQDNACSFIHKSFYEFFLLQSILQSAGSEAPLPIRVERTQQCLSTIPGHESRRIQDEPQTLLFLEDIWIGRSETPLIQRLKETFFAVIETSTAHSKHGAAAANAITILNWMGTMLMYKSWQNIQIPGANLSYAQLQGSNLIGANLEGAKLFRANLSDVNLIGANLKDVAFMERTPIQITESCNAIAYHPAKSWIAITEGNNIRQYDAKHNKWINPPLVGHTAQVTSVTYSPDGMYLASGSQDNTIRQWVAETGQPHKAVMMGHSFWISSVTYSRNGEYLASGSQDSTIRQWVAETGQLFGPIIKGHTTSVTSVTYSPTGTHLASGSQDSTIRQWVAETGEPFGPIIKGHTASVTSVTYSPTGTHLASGSQDSTIRQWVASSGEPFGPLMAGHKNHITSITYSPTGKHLVSGSIDKTIRQWVASTGDPFSPVIAGHTLPVTSVTYSPTGTYLASASKDKTIRQWVASTGESFGPIMVGHTDWVTSVNYSPKGEHLASGGWDRTVRQWGTQSGELSGSVMQAGKSTVTAVTYSREGTYLASGNDDGTIRQWDASTGQPYKTVINYKSPVGSVSSVNYSPDGKRLASGSQDKKIRQWVASKGDAILPVIKGHTEDVSSVTYSPDGKYLASGSHDNTIRQWDASTGQPYKAVMKGHAGPVTSVAYSPPDGKYLVSASEDKTIRQWVASTGKPFGPIMTGHTDKVNSVSYSSTGQYLASAGDDCRICVWNSGLTGDFSLLWRTRSYSDPLLAIGLRLQGVSGLRNDQKELLSYAGYQEKDKDEPTLFHSLNNYSSKDKVDGKLSNDDKMSDAGSSVEEFNPNVLKQKIAVTENDSFIGKHESDQNLNLENSSTSTTDPSEFSSNLETHGIIPLFKNTLSSSIDSEDDVDSPSVDSLSVTSNTTSEIQSTSDINSIAHSLFVDIVENNNDPQNNKDFLYPSELFVILTTFLEKSTIKQCFDLRLGLEEIISRKLKVFDETISGKWHFIFNDLNQHSMFEKKNFQDLLYETLKHANPSFFENIGYRIDSNQSEIELNDYQIEMLVWKILLHSEILLQQKLENTSNTESITQLKQIDAAIIRVERLFQLICRRTFQFENKIKQKLLALEQKMDSTTHAIKELSSFSLFAKDWSTQLMTEPKICDLIYTYFKFETLVIAEEETIEQLPMRRLKIFSLLNQQQSPSKKKIGFFNHLFYENSELTKHMDAIKRLNNNEKNFTNTELLEYQRLQQEKSDKLLRLLENYKTEILYLNELFEYKPNSQIKEFEAHDKEQRKSYQSIKNRYEFNIQDWQKKMTQDIVKKLKHAEIQEQTKEPKFKFRGGIHG